MVPAQPPLPTARNLPFQFSVAAVASAWGRHPPPVLASALRPWTVVRHGAAYFIGAQVRGAAGEIIVDPGETNSGVYRGGAGAKLEVEIRGFVECARIGAR